MGWLSRLRLKRAAKDYARRLPLALAEGWGSSERYTPAQIRASVKSLKLDAGLIALGYAAFLEEPEFESLKAEMPVAILYGEARDLFSDFLHRRP